MDGRTTELRLLTLTQTMRIFDCEGSLLYQTDDRVPAGTRIIVDNGGPVIRSYDHGDKISIPFGEYMGAGVRYMLYNELDPDDRALIKEWFPNMPQPRIADTSPLREKKPENVMDLLPPYVVLGLDIAKHAVSAIISDKQKHVDSVMALLRFAKRSVMPQGQAVKLAASLKSLPDNMRQAGATHDEIAEIEAILKVLAGREK